MQFNYDGYDNMLTSMCPLYRTFPVPVFAELLLAVIDGCWLQVTPCWVESHQPSLRCHCSPWASPLHHRIRATTSHARLKVRDHCNRSALIGRKGGGDRLSSLHTWRWRPTGPKKTSWMRSLHGVLHGGLWIRVHGLLEFSSSSVPRGGPDINFGRPCFLLLIFVSMGRISGYIAWQIPK